MGLSVQVPPVYMTGVISFHAATVGQPGWLRMDGKTIGNSGSGATSRANADTFKLFEYLWSHFSNAFLPIQDSAGSVSVRGASAMDDFNAGKRMPLHAPDADFLRVLDSTGTIDVGRLPGTHQDGQMPAHTHTFRVDNLDGPSTAYPTGNGGRSWGTSEPTSVAGGTSNNAENRPPNTAFPLFIHL